MLTIAYYESTIYTMPNSKIKDLQLNIRTLTDISTALSKEKDRNKLLETILQEAKKIANVGTLSEAIKKLF